MKYRVGWIVLMVATMGLSPLATVLTGSVYAQAEQTITQHVSSVESPGEGDVMTEGQLAEILVNVLGMAAMLPPNAQQADVVGILLQNGISPRDGWSPANVVTLGNLARILVQSMNAGHHVENPEDDASWVNYLSSVGIEFGTIEEALGQTPVLSSPVALRAVEVSTDPLRRIPFIRPVDEQQLGADLQNFRSLISQSDFSGRPAPAPGPAPVVPPRPRPVTPN